MPPTTREFPADHPVHDAIANRWSPYCYDARPVSREDLVSLFEAARWAASCFNEQPWRYIVGTKEDREQYDRVLACLVEPNQAWAKHAPALALGIAKSQFSRNDKENRHSAHDLGLATAQLTLEATARGLGVHQMGGIHPDKARESFSIPEGFEVVTGIAIGYPAADLSKAPEDLAKRDQSPRARKPLSELVFGATWGEGSPLV